MAAGAGHTSTRTARARCACRTLVAIAANRYSIADGVQAGGSEAGGVIRVAGLCAAVLIAISPALAFPDVHVFEAGAVVGVLCGAAVLAASLALAVFGAITALLVFATALLFMRTPYSLFAALLLGLGLLILLDATHFEQRFARSEGKAWIVRNHLSALGAAALLSTTTALALAVGAATVPQELDPLVRIGLAAAGGILVLAAMMWKALL